MQKWISNYIDELSCGKFSMAIENKHNHIPKSLFRYEVIDSARINTLKNNQIYLAKAETFNDIYDTKGIYYSKNFVHNTVSSYNLVNGQLPISESEFERDLCFMLDTFYNRSGITCFTEDLLNYPMWWSYANRHQGFCVEYDFKGSLDYKVNLFPVVYSRQKINIDNLLKTIVSDVNLESYIQPEMLLLHIIQGTSKHLSWSYEREWRFIEVLERGNIQLNIKPIAIYLGNKVPNIIQIDSQEIEAKKCFMEIAKSLNCKLFQLKSSGFHEYNFDFNFERLL